MNIDKCIMSASPINMSALIPCRTKCKELVSEIAQNISKVDLANNKSKEDQATIGRS
jgi:hypothetical protein